MNTKHNTNNTIAATTKALSNIDAIPENISAPMARLAATEGSASRALDAQFNIYAAHLRSAKQQIGKSVKTCPIQKGLAEALKLLQPLTNWSDATLGQYRSSFVGCYAANLPFDRNYRADSSGGTTTDEVLLQQYLRKACKKAHDVQHKHVEHLIKTAKLFGVTLE